MPVDIKFQANYTIVPMLLLKDIVERAIEEDRGIRDVTTSAVIDPSRQGKARIVAKEDLILAGAPVAEAAFLTLDTDTQFTPMMDEGALAKEGSVVAEVAGNLSTLLTGERVALNFLQRLSGIASLTRSLVEIIKDYPTKILDTRKTTPNLRTLEKYAVQIGGGVSHRWGLYDGIIIKDNHIAACGGITEAVERVREKALPHLKIEVEVKNLKEVNEALEIGAEIIMLDNMPVEEMKKAVKVIDKRAVIEASGGIDMNNILDVAKTGVTYISIGALTHSARAVDISMELALE